MTRWTISSHAGAKLALVVGMLRRWLRCWRVGKAWTKLLQPLIHAVQFRPTDLQVSLISLAISHLSTMYHLAQYDYGLSNMVPPRTTTPVTYPPMNTNTNANLGQTAHHRSSSSGFTSSGTLPYSSAFVPRGNNIFSPSSPPAYGYGPAPVQQGGQVYAPSPRMMQQEPDERQTE